MPPVAPMLAKPAAAIPPGQFYEPKWDGFRSIVFRDGDEVEIGSRKERPMTRYFPEVVEAVRRSFPPRAVIDGEIVIAGDGGLDFWALQQRIHPAASRVAMLAGDDPGELRRLRPARARRRRPHGRAVRATAAPRSSGRWRTPRRRSTSRRSRATSEVARDWFERFEGAGLDGLIAKRADLTYQPDKRVMTKIKHVRTADCVVAGYRVHKTAADAIGSLLLGLYVDDAAPRVAVDGPHERASRPVGVIGAFPMARRRELFAELQPLVIDVAEHPWSWAAELGRAPEGGSRWNPRKDLSFVPLRPGAGRRGALRLPRGRALPPPAAVRALAPGPRPGLVRLRAARAAGAVRRGRRAPGAGPGRG